VIARASRALTVANCINRSRLWSEFMVLQLTVNMRVQTRGCDSRLVAFDAWGVSIGDGTAPTEGDPAEEMIKLPEEQCFPIQEDKIDECLHAFCDTIYPRMAERYKQTDYMQERTVLAPTNASVARINNYLMSKLPTEEVVLLSADSTVQPGDAVRHPPEFLNTLEPQGMPVHKLVLRPGCLLRLMRNINPKEGLCNGTRMRFIRVLGDKVLQCSVRDKKVMGGERDVFIPRLQLPPKKVEQYGIDWVRRQFPVRPAFAQTVNASQGQTMRKVGVWLVESPCFTHGQLYVAASRVGHPDDLHFAVITHGAERNFQTKNIVFREVLLHKSATATPTKSSAISLVTLTDPPAEQDYEGLYDAEEEEGGGDDFATSDRVRVLPKRIPAVNLSAPLPPGVTEAELPTRQETEVAEDMQSVEDAHAAWVASLPDPQDAPLTEEEEDRQAMLARRYQYFENLAKNATQYF